MNCLCITAKVFFSSNDIGKNKFMKLYSFMNLFLPMSLKLKKILNVIHKHFNLVFVADTC